MKQKKINGELKKTRRGVKVGRGVNSTEGKKMQVRHLISHEAILKQDSAGLSLY